MKNIVQKEFIKIKNKKMAESLKFQGKFRIASNRLPKHAYASGMYFVTIVVKGTDIFRPHSFGEIIDSAMILNELGTIAEYELSQTAAKRPNVSIPSYIIMPDHVHFILNVCNGRDALHASHYKGKNIQLTNDEIAPSHGAPPYGSIIYQGDACNASLPNHSLPNQSLSDQSLSDHSHINHFGPQSNNVASIIRGFKSAVTSYARKHNIPFKRQPNYYEHIIMDEKEMYRIMRYIENNPKNWGKAK